MFLHWDGHYRTYLDFFTELRAVLDGSVSSTEVQLITNVVTSPWITCSSCRSSATAASARSRGPPSQGRKSADGRRVMRHVWPRELQSGSTIHPVPNAAHSLASQDQGQQAVALPEFLALSRLFWNYTDHVYAQCSRSLLNRTKLLQ